MTHYPEEGRKGKPLTLLIIASVLILVTLFYRLIPSGNVRSFLTDLASLTIPSLLIIALCMPGKTLRRVFSLIALSLLALLSVYELITLLPYILSLSDAFDILCNLIRISISLLGAGLLVLYICRVKMACTAFSKASAFLLIALFVCIFLMYVIRYHLDSYYVLSRSLILLRYIGLSFTFFALVAMFRRELAPVSKEQPVQSGEE